MFLLYMMVMSAAPSLLNTVLEEKMAKISEVLLSSVTPFQLMLGKLFGTVLVSLTLSTLYLSSAVFMLWKANLLHLVPPQIFLWFLLFQLLALLIFGSLFSAVGAACSEIRDAQNFMFPVMMMVTTTWSARSSRRTPSSSPSGSTTTSPTAPRRTFGSPRTMGKASKPAASGGGHRTTSCPRRPSRRASGNRAR